MPESEANAAGLNAAERTFLRELAQRAVAAAVQGAAPPDPLVLAAQQGLDPEPRLTAKRGAFVTLHLAGRLRGCIGYIEGVAPLVDAVVRNAGAAACRDPRFAPVSAEELPNLDLEISALTPLRAVDTTAEIVVGRHGIVLAKAGRQAVFLPQVATEQGWDLTTTLQHLARKAGLAPDDWRQGARFQVFEAEVF